MTSIVSWPYQRTDCSYIHHLYAALPAIADEALEIFDYRPGRMWRRVPDVLHLHWPETALDHPWYPRALLRALVVLVDIAYLKARGATVVWTRHDDGSHRQTHPRSERAFVSLYRRLTDGFIHLSNGSLEHFEHGGARQTVIAHGIGPIGATSHDQRLAAKTSLGLGNEPVVGIVGRLQGYKNVIETIDAFGDVGRGRLLIAGEPIGDEYGAALRNRQGSDRVTMVLGRLSAADFDRCLQACDVVLLPYSGHLNSGVAFEALATPSRIAVSTSPAMQELQDLAGTEWVQMISAPPTPEIIEEMIDWAAIPMDPSESRLADTWEQVAIETWSYLQALRASK